MGKTAAMRFAAGTILPLLLVGGCTEQAGAEPQHVPSQTAPEQTALLDLMTIAGTVAAGADWRYADARPVPQGALYDLEPKAGAKTFDDSRWLKLKPGELRAARSPGKLCFGWYRTAVKIPDKVDGRATEGAKVELEVVVDDYAEVWIDGQLPRQLGQAGGSVIAGFNSPNRIVLTNSAAAGQRFQIAIFAINGPISEAPDNHIFMRRARLRFTWR